MSSILESVFGTRCSTAQTRRGYIESCLERERRLLMESEVDLEIYRAYGPDLFDAVEATKPFDERRTYHELLDMLHMSIRARQRAITTLEELLALEPKPAADEEEQDD